MSSFERRSLLDRLVGACFSLLLGALAVYVAVQLIEAVWQTLVIAGGVVLGLVVTIALVRWCVQRRSW